MTVLKNDVASIDKDMAAMNEQMSKKMEEAWANDKKIQSTS